MALQESVESCPVGAPPQHQVLVAKPRRVPVRKLNDFGPVQLGGASLKKRELSCILSSSKLSLN